jgi:hypothetical protein
VKRKGIRAIDRGTRYDITGQLRLLARKIERGEYGDVRHVMCGVCANEGTFTSVVTLGFGNQTVPEAHHTVSMMAKRLVSG